MNTTFETIFGLLGGLAIFIFGMNMMSECLQKAAGDKMKKILGILTKNPVMGVLAGALATAVLQSSSATTVMVIGFVSAGLMSLPQGISVILGANIGTTMTAQIIAFKISDYIYIVIFVGFILAFIAKSEKVKNIGQTIFAFGLLFTGIETMGSVMKPLASSPVFLSMIEKVADIPVLGVCVGTLMMLVVQSSSATIAVLQNFAAQAGPDGVSSILGLTGAIPILLGDNIGTTITALLACIGQSKNAKRTAVAHCVFNISGCFLFIWFIKPFAAFVEWISPKGPEIEVIARQIANAHTTFNITMTLIWLPLIGIMVKIVMKLIPDGKGDIVDKKAPLYLDEKIMNQPAAALKLVTREVLHCNDIVKEMFTKTTEVVTVREEKVINQLREEGRTVRNLYDSIMEYLANLFSAGVLTEEQATQTAGLMYILSDIDRMGSLCTQIGENVRESLERGYKYSEEAIRDVEKSLELIQDMYQKSMQMLENGEVNQEDVESILNHKDDILNLDIYMRKSHMNRVNQGKCRPEMTGQFTRILHIINRMGNACTDMMDTAVSKMNFQYFLGTTEE